MTLGAAASRAAYSMLLRLAMPLYMARLWWRGAREPLYRAALAERLGFAPRERAPDVPGRLWIHAVSLGETRAAAALIDALRSARPGIGLLLTHGTATGRAAGAALLREGDAQCWLPYDTPGAVRRFLDRHRPVAGVLMETEVWPNLAHAAAARGLPVVLANARLSERSLRKGLRLAALMRPAAASITRALAQTVDDAQRLRAVGVRDAVVSGNLKFDVAPDAGLLERGRAWRTALGRPVVLAASTREGEEAPLLAAWRRLPLPRPLLLLVPRHPQRFDEVAALVAAAGLALVRRSSFETTPPAEASACDVWLGDSMGEMPLYGALAAVALLGGSFAPLGGQNLIELAACGCPVVMGPHTFNFADAAGRARAAGAAERVADIGAGVQRAAALATTAERSAMADRALAFAAGHRGAAARMAGEVLSAIGEGGERA
jgi:3-deoxy-D-manno-octulosonic-acid transferase